LKRRKIAASRSTPIQMTEAGYGHVSGNGIRMTLGSLASRRGKQKET